MGFQAATARIAGVLSVGIAIGLACCIPAKAEQVSITVLGCENESSKIPTFYLKNVGETVWTKVVPADTNQSGDFFRFSLELGQGEHSFRVVSDRCIALTSFTVLPGLRRSIFLVLGKSIELNDLDHTLVGVLPAPDFIVTAVAPDGKVFLAEMDGSAYYFEHLGKQAYKLRIWVRAEQYVEIPIVIESAFTRRDITAADLRGDVHYGP
jgi:hypothetical protein